MVNVVDVNHLNVFYGQTQALFDVCISIPHGEIVAVIGANGAGKSTLMRTIAGLQKYSGEIKIFGETAKGMPAESIVRKGVCLVPEGRRIFAGLTVIENMKVPSALWNASSQQFNEILEQMFTIFPRLKIKFKSMGWMLSGGEQQMLAIARALIAKPKVLMLDEPSLGLAPNIVEEVFDTIIKIKQDGVTVMIVEQNANLALEMANSAYVMENGNIILSGDAKSLLDSDEVRRAYLGAI